MQTACWSATAQSITRSLYHREAYCNQGRSELIGAVLITIYLYESVEVQVNHQIRIYGLGSFSMIRLFDFYVFSTLWSKNAVLRLKIHSRFCSETLDIKGFLSSQNLPTSSKNHFYIWPKSYRLQALNPLIHLTFRSLDNTCLHFFYTLFLSFIWLEIGAERGVKAG